MHNSLVTLITITSQSICYAFISASRDTCIKKWSLNPSSDTLLYKSINNAHKDWINGLSFLHGKSPLFLFLYTGASLQPNFSLHPSLTSSFLLSFGLSQVQHCFSSSHNFCSFITVTWSFFTIRLSITLFFCISIYPTIFLTTYISFYISIYLSIFLSIYISFYPNDPLFIYLSFVCRRKPGYLSFYLINIRRQEPFYLSILSIYLSILCWWEPGFLSIYLIKI